MGSPFANVDLALLKKYDRPGPRYTSYPTAPLFKDAFTAADYRDEIVATNAPGVNADLSLYYPFPVLRHAVLLLRLHHAGDARPCPHRRVQQVPEKEMEIDRTAAGAGAPGGAAALGRRHADAPVP